MEPVLFRIALWSFFSGMIMHFIGIFPREGTRPTRLISRLAAVFIAVGLASLTAVIAIRWTAQGRPPISSSYEYLNFVAWFVALFYFIVMYKVRRPFIGACISPGIFLSVVFAGMYPQRLEMTLVPALQSYWLQIHVSMTIVGEAAFAVAFVTSMLYLIKNTRWEQVSAEQTNKSFLLFAAALAAGMFATLGLRAAGITLTGLDGVTLFFSLLGGATLIAFPLYVFAWRRLLGAGTGNYGGLLFALTVMSLLSSGMIVGAVVNRNTERMTSLANSIRAIDQLNAELPPGTIRVDETAWEAARAGNRDRLALYLELENLHAETKHTLNREDAAHLLANHPAAGEVPFPITLGEIREVRRSLQGTLLEQDRFIRTKNLPISVMALHTERNSMVDRYNALYNARLLPMDEGRESTFIGYMLVLGIPFFMLYYFIARRIQSRVPSLELLDSMSYRTISLGFPIFTFGALIAGAIWAHYAWGKWWSNDPKEMGSLVIWLIYLVYLHARYVRRWGGNQSAIAAILGFLFCVLTFVGNSVLGGLHAYG